MTETIEPLLYWIKEREKIRVKRAAGEPAPWTEDPILQKYRFCNVCRRQDRVSQWLIKNVLTEENLEKDPASFLMFSALCRFINWPPTINRLMNEGFYPAKQMHWKRMGQKLDQWTKEDKVWTGAYMVRAPRTGPKGEYVTVQCIKPLRRVLAQLRNPSMEETWQVLSQQFGFGSFMAGQVIADWTYTPWLRNAVDLYTWAPQGPGSIRGFNRLLGSPLTQRIPKWDWLYTLSDWRDLVCKEMNPLYLGFAQRFTMMDLQNCLCEYSKYARVKEGGSPPRATYKPEWRY